MSSGKSRGRGEGRREWPAKEGGAKRRHREWVSVSVYDQRSGNRELQRLARRDNLGKSDGEMGRGPWDVNIRKRAAAIVTS